ncbi:zinc finger, CCHC-type containing protein [Tanacetum coccineum]
MTEEDVLLAFMNVVYMMTTPIPEDDGENAIVDQIRLRNNHLRIEESLRAQDSDKPKGNNVVGPAVVRLPDPKLKTLGERGIECIFDAIIDENRLSLVPRPSLSIPKGTEDINGSVVLEEVIEEVVQQPEPELRKIKRNRTPKDFRLEFQLHLIEGTRDEKEAINNEMESIMGNNTWVLVDLPPGYKPLGCKWIFKRKLKVDGTIEKFKARLVIQCFKRKSGIDYVDTYTPVVRISTIRLLIAMASIHNLVIHQMDVKTSFLNGDLDEEEPKQWSQKFDEVVLSNGYLLNQADKYVYSKFDESGKGSSFAYMPDIAFVMGKLSMYTSNPSTQHWQAIQRVLKYLKKTMDYILTYTGYPSVLEGYIDASWISNTEDNSSTSGWVFLLGGGAISWAFKKQTCITGSTMESEFVALVASGKKAEWLKNLLLWIPLWFKPIVPISIRCDSAATLAKAYSQMYNKKSRHLGVRHNMIRELITNEVISIEFVSVGCGGSDNEGKMVTGWWSGDDDGVRGDGSGGEMTKVVSRLWSSDGEGGGLGGVAWRGGDEEMMVVVFGWRG